MGRIVCFGELLLRLTAPGRELLLQTGRLDVHVGGAEANVAIGLARLGHEAAMISRVPEGALGDAAAGHLRRYGVSTAGVATGPGRMGLYFLSPGAGLRPSDIIYDREGSSFALAGPGDFDWDGLLDGADLLHLSGITPALGERSAAAAVAAAEAARARGIKVSFDGNYRAQLWERWDSDPKAVLGRLVGQADILFGNHRDISLLLGRAFSGEGEERRREPADAMFAHFPPWKFGASLPINTIASYDPRQHGYSGLRAEGSFPRSYERQLSAGKISKLASQCQLRTLGRAARKLFLVSHHLRTAI
jgi:2-dehydro-3-deoxygluconokinase